MALTRVWTPSGNYSGGGTKRILVIHTMEGFTGANGASDCAHYFQGDVGASSQVCIDNNRGKIWECVSRGYGSWTQCNYNSVAVSCEQSGYASWSRDYWLNNRSNQLHNIADWLAEESKKLGIPLQDISSSAAQGGSWGVCYHSELGSSGCGHSDPGSGFPLDKVLEWARGGGGGESTSPTGAEFMSASVATYDGKQYFAYVDPSGKVCVNGGACDPSQTGARSGAGITIDPENGRKVVVYTNSSGVVCTYTQDPGGPWRWASKEWPAK